MITPAVVRSCWCCGDTKVRGHCCSGLGESMQLPCVVCVPGAVMQCSCPPPVRNPHITKLLLDRQNIRLGT